MRNLLQSDAGGLEAGPGRHACEVKIGNTTWFSTACGKLVTQRGNIIAKKLRYFKALRVSARTRVYSFPQARERRAALDGLPTDGGEFSGSYLIWGK
jgi:hypothetical protein